MSTHEYSVEFRIYSRTLDRETLTKELGIEPNPLPEPVRPASKSPPRIWATTGIEPSEEDTDPHPMWDSLEQGMTFVLDKLWPYREAIARYKSDGQLIWWCGHFQTSFDGGPTLSAPLLKRLGEFGVELYIDNYHSRDRKDPTSENTL
jgi:hypothetical protein